MNYFQTKCFCNLHAKPISMFLSIYRKNSVFIILFSVTMTFNCMAQSDTVFLKTLLEGKPELFSDVLNHPTKNEIQIVYTQINRDRHNKPSFKTFTYRSDPTHYFYPASTVKLAGVIFSLEKVNELKKKYKINAASVMLTDSNYAAQTAEYKDESAENGLPSIAQYIKKVLLTSDNDAFNRLFEFIGRETLNAKLKSNGLVHSRILNRLAIGDGGDAVRHTNPIRFYEDGQLVYSQPAAYDTNDYPLILTNLTVGTGYLDSEDKLVEKPYSFADKNAFAVEDQQQLMKKLLFPETFPKRERYNLTDEDYRLIYTYMSEYPTESAFPHYDASEFWPTYAKMLFYGRDKKAKLDPNIRIFNKYGDSYGFIIDNSYFVDFNTGVEYLLTTVVQSNENGIYNDNKYEYETVCYPFMKNLGRTIYALELARKKEHLPKLDKFRLNYR